MTTTNYDITIEELLKLEDKGKLHELHTSWCLGYESRKTEGSIFRYKGKFGSGYIWRRPSWVSTQYCHVTYFVE